MQGEVRVLLVEDQDMTAEVIRLYLESSGRFIHIDTIKNASLAPVHCARGGVDLVLMDVYTELGADGLDAAGIIKREFPHIKVIVITTMPEVSYLKRARENHVDSFWYKEASREELLSIMDRTMNGEQVYPDQTPDCMLGLISVRELTQRELDVLYGLVRGESNQFIADQLFVSPETVKTHLKSLLSKTGFSSRMDLAVKARALGLIIPHGE